MRLVAQLLIVSMIPLVVVCTNSSGDAIDSTAETSVAETVGARGSESQLQSSSFDPIDRLAEFIFSRDLATTHVFGITNTEGDEVYFASGRLGLPTQRNTSGWSAEVLGHGGWIVDTGDEIYEVYDSTKVPVKLWP